MRGIITGTVLVVLAASATATPVVADISEYLLPNGEPIVGVYYYPWYRGEPYQKVGWTPEFAYDNIGNAEHIFHVLRAMTDYGINHAAYSYWNNTGSLGGFVNTFEENEKLLAAGRPLYISPYLEPPTIDKQFAEVPAQEFNTEFITTYLKRTGSDPSFAQLGDDKFTNIYVTYYQPTETDEDFRAYLQGKYGTVEALRAAWSMREEGEGYAGQAVPQDALPQTLDGVTKASAEGGTRAFADLQELRAERLREGWGKTIADVQDSTGFTTRYTGDVANTIVSPVSYMEALTGLSWYSFGYALNNPFQRPKMVSEIAKYTDTTFLYTISPGYVDRQQRWPGARVERDPFLYPYAWVHAIKTLPEGIMILTHSEWFEGSIIDVTREYGKQQYETTELYSSVFRAAYPSIYQEKRRKQPVAVILNEWATWNLHERGSGLEDVYGIIKALECLSVSFDVIPDSKLTEAELEGRTVVFVPNCGASLRPGANEMLLEWAQGTEGASLVADRSPWWATALGYEHEDGVVDEAMADTPHLPVMTREFPNGGSVSYVQVEIGREFLSAFAASAARGEVPQGWLRSFIPGELLPAGALGEICRGPTLKAENTLIIPAANVLPWGYLVEHRAVGGGTGRGHSAENTLPWERDRVEFRLPVGDGPVAEVMALDSDSGRFREVDFTARDGELRFTFPMKFHALFAAPQSPVRLNMPALSVHPGETSTAPATVRAFAGGVFNGQIRLRKTPGLSMEPVQFTLAEGQGKRLELQFTADKSYATGNRVLVLEVEADNQTALFWRPAVCRAPALIGTRTKLLSGIAGKTGEVDVRLINVGEAKADNLTVELLGARAVVEELGPDDEATVRVKPTFPDLPPPGATPDVNLSITFDDPPAGNGLRFVEGDDGVLERVQRGGQLCVIPDQSVELEDGRRPAFVYLIVDDARVRDGDYDLEAEVEFFDEGRGSLMLEYDSTFGDDIDNRYRDTSSVSLRGSGTWSKAVFRMPHARMSSRQNSGADFRTNGVVAIRSIALRPMQREPIERTSTEMRVSYQCFDEEWDQRLTVDLTLVAETGPARRPDGVPEGAIRLFTASPYGGHLPEFPIEVKLPDWAEDRFRGVTSVGAMTARGTPIAAAFNQGTLRYVAPVQGAGGAVWVWPSDAPPGKPVELQPGGAGDEQYVAATNAYLSLLWDEVRGGALVSLISRDTGEDYAAFPAGAVTCEYTLPDGRHEVSSAHPGTLNPGRGGIAGQAAELDSEVEMPHCRVTDHWTVYADSRLIRLDRHVKLTQNLEAKEFSPLCLRLQPGALASVLPLGVGFQQDDGTSRGWLETWHLPGWHYSFAGSYGASADAVGLSVLDTSSLKRVRYGFVPGELLPDALSPGASDPLGDELQVRYKAQAELSSGRDIRLTAFLLVGPGMSYRAAQEARLLALRQPLVAVGDEMPSFDGMQTIVPRAPVYMFEVREPEFE